MVQWVRMHGSHVRELSELVSVEVLALLRDVDPQAAMTTDARSALDCKANNEGIMGLGSNVDILASNIRRAVVVEGQQIDLVGHHCFRYHVDKKKSCPASSSSWAVGETQRTLLHVSLTGVGARSGLLPLVGGSAISQQQLDATVRGNAR